ncbi:MAG: thioredoxin family protein [Thermoleophilia bacterium]|nr:thioredoxin family protein [Thermoleophilia bacterium]
MATVEAPRNTCRTAAETPLLLLFMCHTNGQARRVEGFIAHALQRRSNHEAFRYRVIDQADRPDLFSRFDVEEVPTVLVVNDKHVVRRLSGNVRPSDLERELGDWLR